VISREDNKNPLFPQTSNLAAIGGRFAREKCNILPMMLDGGNVLCWTILYEVDMREGILRLITLQQIGKEAGGQRRKNADSNDADFATSCRTRIF
jgi:hypothetical protein